MADDINKVCAAQLRVPLPHFMTTVPLPPSQKTLLNYTPG